MADFPNPETEATTAASPCDDMATGIGTLREFEAFLRRHGFSRRRAKAIAVGGFNANPADAAAVLRRLAKVLDGQNVSV